MLKSAQTISRRLRLSITAIATAVVLTGAALAAFFATAGQRTLTEYEVKVQWPVSSLDAQRVSKSEAALPAVAR